VLGVLEGGWFNEGASFVDGESSSFWNDLWLDRGLLHIRFSRLFDIHDDKNISFVEIRSLGLGVEGEGWRWR